MSHASSHSTRPPITALLAAGFALFVGAAPAHAGLGDMMKKATDKATKAATQKATPAAPCPPVQHDAVTVELTNDRVEKILATFKAAGEAGAGRPALVEKLNKLNEDQSKIMDKHGESIQNTRNERMDTEACYQEGYQTAWNRKIEEYKQRALTDPVLLAKYQKAAAENNAAAAQGDSAALGRIMKVFNEEVAPSRDDTLQVQKDCGPLPPRSAAEAQVEALDIQIRAANDSIARIDERVAKSQAKQGGLDEQQWFTALERIRAYLGWKGSHPTSKSKPCGFNDAEFEALEKHREQLSATLG